MAEITTTQAFSDGDTVTATKLNNITANAAIQTEAITNRSSETTVDQANDLLLMYDASATALKKVSLSNVIKAGTASNFPVTGNTTIGGNLGVTGESTLTGNTTVGGTLGVTGASTLTGNTSILGTLGVDNQISATKPSGVGLSVTSDASVGGDLAVVGDIDTDGNATIDGALGVIGNVSVNTDKFNVTSSSGNTSIGGTLGVAGDVSVNTNKFNVTAESGNTSIAGTLGVAGDVSVNTNKFNVTAASGNTSIAGTLGVTGAITASSTINGTTIPTSKTIVTTNDIQTLSNKELTTPVISQITNTGTLTLPTSTDTLVGRATTDTLTNKTLTSPVISSISNTGTLTLPTSTDTLVGRDTTDTLTNKTLTSPTLTTPILGTPQSGTLSNCSGLPVSGISASTTSAIGVGSIELGHASDTTLARGSAGRLTVEGVNIPTISSTDTLTNKTLTSPAINTATIAGGTINNATIGATTPSSGVFSSCDISLAGSPLLRFIRSGTADLIAQCGASYSIIGTEANLPLHLQTNSTVKLIIGADGVLDSNATYTNTNAGAANVVVTSDGLIRRSSSSIKYKKDVENLYSSIVDNAISNLRPVWYRSKDPNGDDKQEWSHIGLIAEEVAQVEPRLVCFKTMEAGFDENKNKTITHLDAPIPENVDYARLAVILLAEVQSQRNKISNLETRIAALESA